VSVSPHTDGITKSSPGNTSSSDDSEECLRLERLRHARQHPVDIGGSNMTWSPTEIPKLDERNIMDSKGKMKKQMFHELAGVESITATLGPKTVKVPKPKTGLSAWVWNTEKRNQKPIEVRGFRVSCISAEYDEEGHYGGVVIYSSGKHGDPPCATRMKPGYVFLAKTDDKSFADFPESEEGAVHGRIVKRLFETNMEPKCLVEEHGVVMIGFALYPGDKLELTSRTLNKSTEGWHDGRTEANDIEEFFLINVLKRWKCAGPGTTIMVKDMLEMKM